MSNLKMNINVQAKSCLPESDSDIWNKMTPQQRRKKYEEMEGIIKDFFEFEMPKAVNFEIEIDIDIHESNEDET